MPYSRKRWSFRLLALTLCLVCITAVTASAHDLSPFYTDSTTGWHKWDNRHMGTRYTTYAYGSNYTKTRFQEYIEAGIQMWGVSIHCTEDADNPEGIIISIDDYSTATASVSSTFNANTGLVTSWTMEIYDFNIPSDPDPESLKRTFAHEIGHVYGLNHVLQSSQIMYGQESATKAVTIYDMRGMLVMTHQHIHGEETNYTIERDTYTHNSRCNTCFAYEIVNCYTSEYHYNGRHYFTLNCECGNTGDLTIICPDSECALS